MAYTQGGRQIFNIKLYSFTSADNSCFFILLSFSLAWYSVSFQSRFSFSSLLPFNRVLVHTQTRMFVCLYTLCASSDLRRARDDLRRILNSAFLSLLFAPGKESRVELSQDRERRKKNTAIILILLRLNVMHFFFMKTFLSLSLSIFIFSSSKLSFLVPSSSLSLESLLRMNVYLTSKRNLYASSSSSMQRMWKKRKNR